MTTLDKLDELEKGATGGPWEMDIGDGESYDPIFVKPDTDMTIHDMNLIDALRNNARALIDVARAADILEQYYGPHTDADLDRWKNLREALSRLEGGGDAKAD